MSWWDDAVGYEVYLRSFADGDGDGVGDFDGITSRLDHLAWLGVDVVWVTPFYPSPQADFGYDVADYTGVDPVYGDMAAFDRFAVRARELGLRVMVDLVPNHTSNRHPWFRSAVADPDGPHRDYYIFRPPAPDGGPPNNWVSHFGGPAWTLDPGSGEYYCHLFLAEQPDLNWASEKVRDEFDRILRFWIDRGVDGFRIDVAHALMKHPEFADNPRIAEVAPDASPQVVFAGFDHAGDMHQDATKEIYRRWKALPGAADTLLLGEVYVREVGRSVSYLGGAGLDHALFFALNRRQWDPRAFADEIRTWADASPDGFGWTIASHDENRPVTRFGSGEKGRERALTLWAALAFLPGMPFLYQGEELGLEDGHVAPEDVQDPAGIASYADGRDPCRTPMPWDSGPHNGFTTGSTAWLRSTLRSPEETVAAQREDPESPLHRYRSLLDTRRRLSPNGTVVWLDGGGEVVAYRRDQMCVVANLGDDPATVEVPGEWVVVYDTNGEVHGDTGSGSTTVPPRSAQVVTIGSDPR